MNPPKISHLKEEGLLRNDSKKRTVLTLPGDSGQIVSYQPFQSMQLIFFDVYTADLPDMWENGFRKGNSGRYLRTLIAKRGRCVFTVNGKQSVLAAGQVMMDYSVGDDKQFTFTTDSFTGVEITMQVDTLVEENSMMKMLRLVIESMGLPEEEIYDADGYVFNYSKNTGQTLDKLLSAGLKGKTGIVTLAQTVEIGHNLGTDIKSKQHGSTEKQTMIAEEVFRALTDDFGSKNTAVQFAEKYGISDTTVKKYFKKVYGYGFKEYQNKVRMEWAAEALENTDMKVGEISEKTGYARHTKFSKAFKDYYGESPLAYRRLSRIKSVNAATQQQKDDKNTY